MAQQVQLPASPRRAAGPSGEGSPEIDEALG